MFIPFSHLATGLSLLVSSQLALPSVSRLWTSEREGSRCAVAWHDHRSDRPAAAVNDSRLPLEQHGQSLVLIQISVIHLFGSGSSSGPLG